MWIVEKASYRRLRFSGDINDADKDINKDYEKFTYPYDLGWRENIRQVFSVNYLEQDGGIVWSVKKGCDQYTLTVSRLKLDKIFRTDIFL